MASFELNSFCNVRATALYEEEVELKIQNCKVCLEDSTVQVEDFRLDIGTSMVVKSLLEVDGIDDEQRSLLSEAGKGCTLWLQRDRMSTHFGFDFVCLTALSATSQALCDGANSFSFVDNVRDSVGGRRNHEGQNKHQHERRTIDVYTLNATYDGSHTLKESHVEGLLSYLRAANIVVNKLTHVFIVPPRKEVKLNTDFVRKVKDGNAKVTVMTANHSYPTRLF